MIKHEYYEFEESDIEKGFLVEDDKGRVWMVTRPYVNLKESRFGLVVVRNSPKNVNDDVPLTLTVGTTDERNITKKDLARLLTLWKWKPLNRDTYVWIINK